MDRLLRYFVRRGLRDGVLGGKGAWAWLGGAALFARFAIKAMRRRPEVVFSEQLGVGERLVIAHGPRTGHNGQGESPAPQP